MLFEHLALNDEMERVASRKALALARVRAEKSFGRFIRAARTEDDREARLTLVAGDLEKVVKQACADCDYQAYDNVLATVQEHLGFVVEARRPKMCPYHNEVTDISLAAGEPQAGFSAMAQHAWGPQHCQGGEYEGRCNFKPEMTTQTYWDQKAEKAEERRLERQQQRELEVQQPTEIENIAPENETESPVDETPVAPEPSAVGMGAEPAVAEPQMAMAASTHEAEALKTVDVEQGGDGPSPKMDKRKWTPENVRFLDNVDSKDGPHPTIHQDIAQPAQYKTDAWSDDGRFEQTDAVSEKQDVEKSSNPTDGGGPATSTFPNKGQAKPVTSNVLPDDYEAARQAMSDIKKQHGGFSQGGDIEKYKEALAEFNSRFPSGPPKSSAYDNGPDDYAGEDTKTQPGETHTRCPNCGNPDGVINGKCVDCGYKKAGRSSTAAVDPDKNPIAEFLEEEEAQRAISEFNAE